MKFLVILSLFLVSSNAINPQLVQEFLEKVTKFGEMCMEETKATSEDIAQLMAHQIPATHEGKCMVSCVYKKFKIQNEDGTINDEVTKELMSKVKDDDPELYGKFLTVFENCHGKDLVVEDHCMTAVNVATCVVVEAKKAGITSDMFGM